MLHYMRNNKIRTIDVVAEPTLKLKEYSEFPKEIRDYMESNPTEDIKLPDDMITIKDKVTLEKAKSWIYIIETALKNGFNEVFTPNFIQFRVLTTEDAKHDKKYPLVRGAYTVSTGEIFNGLYNRHCRKTICSQPHIQMMFPF